MEERKTPAKVFNVTWHCDCGGEMKFSGLKQGNMFQHVCVSCQKSVMLDKAYPMLTTEKEESSKTDKVLDLMERYFKRLMTIQ